LFERAERESMSRGLVRGRGRGRSRLPAEQGARHGARSQDTEITTRVGGSHPGTPRMAFNFKSLEKTKPMIILSCK